MTVEVYFLIWLALIAINLKVYWWDGPVGNPAAVALFFPILWCMSLVISLDEKRIAHQKRRRENAQRV